MPRRMDICDQPRKKFRGQSIDEAPSTEVSFFDDEALPPGIIFTDVLQKKWRIGNPIGRGSFGRIYLASDDIDKEVSKQNARYVVKIEPHTNGPLFVEVHCLIRTAQADKVNAWRLQKMQKRLGMPIYIASGSFLDENTNIKYRFLVLPRYEVDLQKIIARNKILGLRNVLVLSVQILDVLEYLHKQGYTHSDIKSSNLMLGFDGQKFGRLSMTKTLSFQKDIKEGRVVVSRKLKRPKMTKSRTSNYYEDEDFVVANKSSSYGSIDDVNNKERKSKNVKNISKNLSDHYKIRSSYRHHAFNLRQLSNYVDYEDLNSSICSDRSYQKLLDSVGNKKLPSSSDKSFAEENFNCNKKCEVSDVLTNTVFKEAVLSQSNGQIYLLDYGLASKFLDSDGQHKDFGMDARKAHDGTLEYSSRDSHIGAHSRRSDLETLGYNILDWLTGILPWKTTEMLSEPDLVHALKKNFMSDVKSLLRTCFKTDFYPKFLEKYLQYVTNLDFTETPDYEYCRNIFRNEFVKNGFGAVNDMLLQFTEPPISSMKRKQLCYTKRFGKKNTPSDFVFKNGVKKAYERENIWSVENDLKLELLKQTLNTSNDGIRKPCTSRNFFISDADLVARLKKSLMPHDIMGKKLSPKNLRSNKRKITKKITRRNHRSSIGKFGNFMGSARQFTWAEILAGNPEDIIRKDRNTTEETDDDNDETCRYRIRKMSHSSNDTNFDINYHSPLLQKDYLQGTNPTYAMKEVLLNFKRKISGKPIKDQDELPSKLEGYTPAMVKLFRIKEKREAKERSQDIKQTVAKENNERTKQENKREQIKIKEKREAKERSQDIKQTVAKENNERTKQENKREQIKIKEKREAKERLQDVKQTVSKENFTNTVSEPRCTRSRMTLNKSDNKDTKEILQKPNKCISDKKDTCEEIKKIEQGKKGVCSANKKSKAIGNVAKNKVLVNKSNSDNDIVIVPEKKRLRSQVDRTNKQTDKDRIILQSPIVLIEPVNLQLQSNRRKTRSQVQIKSNEDIVMTDVTTVKTKHTRKKATTKNKMKVSAPTSRRRTRSSKLRSIANYSFG